MLTSQLTIGFDVPVNADEVAAILKKHYGSVDVGTGILKNGLSQNCLYVHNKRKKKNVK